MRKTLYSIFWVGFALFSFLLSDIYLSQEAQIFKAQALPSDFVFDYPRQFEEVFLKTDSNAMVHGLHFKSKAQKGVVLYFHGRGWNLGSLYKRSGIPEDFLTRGYDFFIIDYRGFGKSVGPMTEQGLFHDANYAYHYLLEQYPEDQITVYGMSFGTGIAAQVASCHQPRQLILEAPYFSMLDMADQAIPYLPKFLVSWLLKYHIRTDQFIKQIACPIHIFHGTHDQLIPYAASKKLIALVRKNTLVKLTSIDNGSHEHLPSYHTYTKQLDLLLN